VEGKGVPGESYLRVDFRDEAYDWDSALLLMNAVSRSAVAKAKRMAVSS
jgi:hypothetical protein